MAECVKCEEEYSDKRLALGYLVCLQCGDRDARKVISARNRASLQSMAPHQFTRQVREVLDKRQD